MATFVGLILIGVSIVLFYARFTPQVQKWIEEKFLQGKDLFDPAAKHALVVQWLQWPALITGVLEELPGGAFIHFLEFAIFVGLFFWKQNQSKNNK